MFAEVTRLDGSHILQKVQKITVCSWKLYTKCLSPVGVQWNLYNCGHPQVNILCGCNIESGCIVEVHNTLAICTYIGTQQGDLNREVGCLVTTLQKFHCIDN